MSVAVINLQIVYEQDVGDVPLDNPALRESLECLHGHVWQACLKQNEAITIKEVKVSMRDKQENKNVQAVCLKTAANAQLGEVEYKIIKDPYERVFEHRELFAMMPTRQKRMAVNVLDANTGLTYAVEYEPANLVCSTSEPKTSQPGKPVDFITGAVQIAEELKVMFNPAGGGISDKCGVAFFAVSDDGNDKTLTSVGFVGGRGDRVSEAIASACSKNPQILEVVKHASVKALFHQIFDGDNKKK